MATQSRGHATHGRFPQPRRHPPATRGRGRRDLHL